MMLTYYDKNQRERIEYQKAYYRRNKDKVSQYYKEYYSKNKDIINKKRRLQRMIEKNKKGKKSILSINTCHSITIT